jgi:hypothetical protein
MGMRNTSPKSAGKPLIKRNAFSRRSAKTCFPIHNGSTSETSEPSRARITVHQIQLQAGNFKYIYVGEKVWNPNLAQLHHISNAFSKMSFPENFKVLIAGGGVAGLTLANMLEKFDIDYTILESHGEIAPPVGASIGLFPNGLRILDQIGCYEPIMALSMEDGKANYSRNENGKVTSIMYDFAAHLKKR